MFIFLYNNLKKNNLFNKSFFCKIASQVQYKKFQMAT